jgi:hypothetical protein
MPSRRYRALQCRICGRLRRGRRIKPAIISRIGRHRRDELAELHIRTRCLSGISRDSTTTITPTLAANSLDAAAPTSAGSRDFRNCGSSPTLGASVAVTRRRPSVPHEIRSRGPTLMVYEAQRRKPTTTHGRKSQITISHHHFPRATRARALASARRIADSLFPTIEASPAFSKQPI